MDRNRITNIPIVTLCGSGKFYETFKKVELDLTLKGYMVLIPSIFNHPNFFNPDKFELNSDDEKLYDEIHRQKILLSKFVVVIDVDGYIGTDTKKEIDFCKLIDTPVISYRDI